jgi:hypothetical protein
MLSCPSPRHFWTSQKKTSETKLTAKLTAALINGTTTSVHTPPATVVAAATATTAISLLSESTHEKLPPLAEIFHDTELLSDHE